MDPLTSVLALAVVGLSIAVVVLFFRKPGRDDRSALAEKRVLDELDRVRTALTESLRSDARAQEKSLAELEVAMAKSLSSMRADQAKSLDDIQRRVDARLADTLETRLGQSFSLVSTRLEEVHRGLGEMRTLAQGVGDLKRVLSNVKVRGTFGEAHLGAMLEQVLAPEQFVENVATIPGSPERVEFAIRLPGDGTRDVLLPVDAKFPQEDYLRLSLAVEAGDQPGIEGARVRLARTVRSEAEAVRDKYVCPPHTTDFAILFFPTEGLFAEVMRVPGLADELQTKHRVIPAGPTTFYALLSSLQMGFRTVAIEKRGAEVWRLLGAVKEEFGKFQGSLEGVQKKLQEASNKIEEATRRTRVMQKKLRDVEVVPGAGDDAPRLRAAGDDDPLLAVEPDAAHGRVLGDADLAAEPRAGVPRHDDGRLAVVRAELGPRHGPLERRRLRPAEHPLPDRQRRPLGTEGELGRRRRVRPEHGATRGEAGRLRRTGLAEDGRDTAAGLGDAHGLHLRPGRGAAAEEEGDEDEREAHAEGTGPRRRGQAAGYPS